MKFRQIAGRPVEDEHSPYHTPRAGFDFQRVLTAVVLAVLLAIAAGLIYGRL